jgi:hypothetical protein
MKIPYVIDNIDYHLADVLNDKVMREVRNKAAHDEVLTKDEARQARTWAIGILGMV